MPRAIVNWNEVSKSTRPKKEQEETKQ